MQSDPEERFNHFVVVRVEIRTRSRSTQHWQFALAMHSDRKEALMKPIAAALPRNGENIERGKFGSAMPKTPANGFTIIANVKPGRAARIREYAASVEKAVQEKTIIDGRTTGFCKLIVDRAARKILGCHIVGERAIEIAQVVSIVIASGMRVDDLARVPLSFPTYAGILGRLAASATRELNLTVDWQANEAEL
jgi:Pyridine nucleotide-disulphide oxidoreductase, dimerisation domain